MERSSLVLAGLGLLALGLLFLFGHEETTNHCLLCPLTRQNHRIRLGPLRFRIRSTETQAVVSPDVAALLEAIGGGTNPHAHLWTHASGFARGLLGSWSLVQGYHSDGGLRRQRHELDAAAGYLLEAARHHPEDVRSLCLSMSLAEVAVDLYGADYSAAGWSKLWAARRSGIRAPEGSLLCRPDD